jgi:hypothetical protein
MEEAYLEWLREPQKQRFPWNWNPETRDIELQINRRLRARGLEAPPQLFCPFSPSNTTQGLCPDTNHPHQRLASQRTHEAINTWGQHLFPLISEAEVGLKGIRSMPNYQEGTSRSNYYGVTGVVDVIGSVNLNTAPRGNLVLHYIHEDQVLHATMGNLSSPEYEIIIDYKGMRRPSKYSDNSHTSLNHTWLHHEWQILTYTWLRAQQAQSKRIVAGILFYFNELVPSEEDMRGLQEEVINSLTDVMPSGLDINNVQNWQRGMQPTLSLPFKELRSIRIIPVSQTLVDNSLQNFDDVVAEIEQSVLSEMGGNSIMGCWKTEAVERTCTACDIKTFCPSPARQYAPTVP